MTKLMKLWRDYSSQEMFGESLREADPDVFDELDAAITEAHAREALVQEVIRLQRAYEAAAGTNARIAAVAALGEAVRKLADRKP